MNILITGCTELDNLQLDFFYDNANNVYFCADEEKELPIPCSEVDYIVCNWLFKYHRLSDFIRLKCIQLISSGVNGIDTDEVDKMGIKLFFAKNVYSIPISEFVVGRILAFYKREHFFYNNQQKHNWIKNRDLQELFGKRVLIVGTGSIGCEVAKRMKVLTGYVDGCNRTLSDLEMFDEVFPLNELVTIVGNYDILILAISLTEETKGIINSDVINMMSQQSIVVNVSRGGVIIESDLEDALANKKIAGAILDVFEEEPLSEDSCLWDMENVMISPHNAFVSERNKERLRNVLFSNYNFWKRECNK